MAVMWAADSGAGQLKTQINLLLSKGNYNESCGSLNTNTGMGRYHYPSLSYFFKQSFSMAVHWMAMNTHPGENSEGLLVF